jgi:hypothetical protein
VARGGDSRSSGTAASARRDRYRGRFAGGYRSSKKQINTTTYKRNLNNILIVF